MLLPGPDERVKRCSSHRASPVSPLFPTAPQFLPTPRSIAKRKPTDKEFATIRSALSCCLRRSTLRGKPLSAQMFARYGVNPKTEAESHELRNEIPNKQAK